MNMSLAKRVEALENRGESTAGFSANLEAGRTRGPLTREETLDRIEMHRAQGFDDLAKALERTLTLRKEEA